MIDLAAITAIDTHVHAEISVSGRAALTPELEAAANAYFGAPPKRPTLPEIAAYYRERNMACVVFTVDSQTATGQPPIPNEEIAEAAAANSDVMIPFASVDPWRGKDGVSALRRLAVDHGILGVKFHPSMQAFDPSDRRFYPIYETLQELGLIALFHSGQTGIGAGAPGGGGIRLKYSNPMLIDDVAADFPGMPIILAHPSFPWQEEALAVALHKAQVYIDLSGWSPKYFPPLLVRYANSLLQDKVLFGTDYPLINPEKWLADFAALDIKESVRPKILKHNAARLLRLAND